MVVLGVQLAGAVLLTLIVYVVQLSPLTTVSDVRYPASFTNDDTFVGTVGTAHQSANVLLLAPQVTKFH